MKRNSVAWTTKFCSRPVASYDAVPVDRLQVWTVWNPRAKVIDGNIGTPNTNSLSIERGFPPCGLEFVSKSEENGTPLGLLPIRPGVVVRFHTWGGITPMGQFHERWLRCRSDHSMKGGRLLAVLLTFQSIVLCCVRPLQSGRFNSRPFECSADARSVVSSWPVPFPGGEGGLGQWSVGVRTWPVAGRRLNAELELNRVKDARQVKDATRALVRGKVKWNFLRGCFGSWVLCTRSKDL